MKYLETILGNYYKSLRLTLSRQEKRKPRELFLQLKGYPKAFYAFYRKTPSFSQLSKKENDSLIRKNELIKRKR